MKLFLLIGLIEGALLAGLGWLGPRIPLPGVAVFGLAFAAYLGAWALATGRGARSDRGRRRGSPAAGHTTRADPDHGSETRHTLVVVWVLAVMMRLALLPVVPTLSDDIYRYLWDGHVQLSGVNPYVYAPNAVELDSLRTGWHSLINNPGVPTIYPPAAQFAFVLIALLGSTLTAAKVLWVGLDLLCGWLLIRVAVSSGRSPVSVGVLYLWSPLLIVETAWSGHLEPLGLAAMAGVLLLAQRRRAASLGVALAIAALVKFAPLAAAPALARRHGGRFIVAALGGLALGYLPYLGAGSALWTGLTTYAEHWRFNAGAFVLLDAVFTDPLAPRWAAGAMVGGVVIWTVWKRMDAECALFWTLGTGVALSPTVHPWYVLWVLPFAALRGNRGWIYLSGSVFLAYWGSGAFRETGQWPEPIPLRLLIWVPFYVLLVVDARRNSRDHQLAQPQPEVAGQEEQQEG